MNINYKEFNKKDKKLFFDLRKIEDVNSVLEKLWVPSDS